MSITAMKQALEALTRIWEDGLENFPESGHDAAITALRTAIEAAKKHEPVAWTLTEELTKRATTTRAHLWFSNPQNCMWTPLYTTPPAAPVQEPVAWINGEGRIERHESAFGRGETIRPLCTTPPAAQQELVLTEREACAALLDANAMACESPIHRSLLQANAEAIRARGQDPMPLFDDWGMK